MHRYILNTIAYVTCYICLKNHPLSSRSKKAERMAVHRRNEIVKFCSTSRTFFVSSRFLCTPTRRRVGPKTIATYRPILSSNGACLYKCYRRFTVFLSYGQLIKPKRGRRSGNGPAVSTFETSPCS